MLYMDTIPLIIQQEADKYITYMYNQIILVEPKKKHKMYIKPVLFITQNLIYTGWRKSHHLISKA